MMYQIWWSESITPEFTDEQKLEYKKFRFQQVYPIGNKVRGRRLFSGIGTKETIDLVISFLTDAGKKPKICDVRNHRGIRYGFTEVIKEIDRFNTSVQIIQDLEESELYPIDESEYAKYFKPIKVKDEEGKEIEVQIPSHSFSGWTTWEERRED